MPSYFRRFEKPSKIINTSLEILSERKHLTYKEIAAENRWLVDVHFPSEIIQEFSVDIWLSEEWVHFSSIVMKNVKGEAVRDFYDFLFRISAILSGAKIGFTTDGLYVTLQFEMPIQAVSPESLFKALQRFYFFLSEWQPVILGTANKLGLKYSREKNKRVNELLNDSELVDKNLLAKFFLPHSKQNKSSA